VRQKPYRYVGASNDVFPKEKLSVLINRVPNPIYEVTRPEVFGTPLADLSKHPAKGLDRHLIIIAPQIGASERFVKRLHDVILGYGAEELRALPIGSNV
jgi:hypothetical protein